MAMVKFPIITAFCWKAGPNSCQIRVTKTCIENLESYWHEEPGDRVQVDFNNWKVRGESWKQQNKRGVAMCCCV